MIGLYSIPSVQWAGTAISLYGIGVYVRPARRPARCYNWAYALGEA